MSDRIFTDEELRIGSLPSAEGVAEAVAAGDFDAAAGFCRRLRQDVLSMKANYDGWEKTLRAFIVERVGAEAEGALCSRGSHDFGDRH